MMSALNAKALRARSATPDDEHDKFATRDTVFDQDPTDPAGASEATSQNDSADRLDISAFWQSLPTPPDPDEMPEPPDGPDIPEPPRRPDIPVPPDPDPIPGTPSEPDPPPPHGESTRSRLMAAFDALTGPMPPRTTVEADTPPEAAAEQPPGDKPVIRDQFESGSGLPSRKPLKSWTELASASTVDSPADNLFGAPAERPRTRFKSSLGAAFASFEPGELPTTPGDHSTEPPPVTTSAGPSAAQAEPSGASVAGVAPTAPTTEPPPTKAPTYDEPFGPERRPEGLPRRGERSATTIASLLTEALAAYQSTTDDEGEPHRGPERFDSFLGDPNTIAGRHRSTE